MAPIKFPSDDWAKAFMEEINQSEAYAEAAETWEGDFYFIVTPEGALKEPVYLYFDLWHGKCRDGFLATDPQAKKPAFMITATLGQWRKVIEKKLDPMQGLMTRQLKLQGDMVKIMKAVKAAQELVNCATKVPTEFPG